MRYRTLGRTGIKVSPYALGAMMFGAAIGNPDHDDSIRIIHKALDAGPPRAGQRCHTREVLHGVHR